MRESTSSIKKWTTAALIIGLSIGFISCQTAPLSLGKNIGLSLSTQTNNDQNKISLTLNAPFIFGLSSGEDSPGQKQSMIFDMTTPLIYVPNSNGGTFGINCDSSTNCKTTSDLSPRPAYGDQSVNGQDANTLLRFSAGKLKDTSYPAPLQFVLAQLQKQWTDRFGQNGLMGFGPTSNIWNFIAATYSPTKGQNYYDTSFYLVARDPSKLADPSAVNFDGSQITVNGRYTSKEQIISSAANTALGAWYFPGASVQPWSKFGQSAPLSGICIDSNVHALLILSPADALALLELISNQLCGQPANCTPDNSKISGVDPIIFYFPSNTGEKLQVTVPASAFITFNGNVANIAITDTKTSNTVCQNSGLSAGRLLLAYTEITIRMQVDNNIKTFYLGASSVKIPSKMFYLWLMIILVGLLAFIFFSIYVVRNHSPNKKYFNGEQIAPADSPETGSD